MGYVWRWRNCVNTHILHKRSYHEVAGEVSSLEAPRRAAAAGAGARLELERRSLDLERELRADHSDASLDDRDHLV
ncbi:hypothetical protein MSG28_011490 [Choristoneura fumiferana]|uniref:Uncharacterized protein n=2 Tax=Choristoneura fumiferana TaxID=7141 RepID=A0ACC0JNP0_CHOFU|nr:hypothetical protein MSG28_011488 [Choristoneura fumiferana]KAI8425679.1 hypothetical protein MSG28_011490 [Choristoneura fumiferana]